jgi:hypothetical protein
MVSRRSKCLPRDDRADSEIPFSAHLLSLRLVSGAYLGRGSAHSTANRDLREREDVKDCRNPVDESSSFSFPGSTNLRCRLTILLKLSLIVCDNLMRYCCRTLL